MEEKQFNQEIIEEALDQRSLATEETQESSIDFGKVFKDILKHKRLYFIVLPLAFILAAIYALSLPNYYNCTVKLASEVSSPAKSGGRAAGIASTLGINLGVTQQGGDAISPSLYPDLMNSVDFKTSLFDIIVTRESDNKSFTYYDYLMNEQKSPWWTKVKAFIFGLFTSSERTDGQRVSKVDPFRLTLEQTAIAGAIQSNVACDVDKKTSVITINVVDQDPLICATLADSVKNRLQKFITDYRTSKARVDLEYNKKVLGEAIAKYEAARDKYARFSDSHRDVSSKSAQTKMADLQNEMQLHQQIMQQVISHLQQAEMKVQEETPAFTTLQSATVPVMKAGPSRSKMCLTFVFLAFLGTTAWILYKEDDLKPLLGLS